MSAVIWLRRGEARATEGYRRLRRETTQPNTPLLSGDSYLLGGTAMIEEANKGEAGWQLWWCVSMVQNKGREHEPIKRGHSVTVSGASPKLLREWPVSSGLRPLRPDTCRTGRVEHRGHMQKRNRHQPLLRHMHLHTHAAQKTRRA